MLSSLIEQLRARIGVAGPAVEAIVEGGHLKRFADAIGDPNPRWLSEAPPTFLAALVPEPEGQLVEAEEYGTTWLNGGTRFEFVEPIKAGDRLTASGRVVDVYEKAGSTGDLLFVIFETEYVNSEGSTVARLRATLIRR
jgi:hypothetical protein